MPGAVASGHPLSSAIGRDVLGRGGNAYDALLAVSAALTVVQPHTNGLGADFFAVVHDRSVRSVNGSGWAAAAATPEEYRRQGLSAVPPFGPLAAVTVPGLVASWSLLAERSTLRLPELLAPAVRLARAGFPATPSLARAARSADSHSDADWRAVYGGVRAGAPLAQRDLGRTLERLAQDSGHSFYHGALARAIERDVVRKGGLLRFADLDAYRARWTVPLRLRYREYDVFTTPPNSQGATALIWLNLLRRERLESLSEADYVASLLRTLPTAYGYRARVIGDPAEMPFPQRLLDPTYRFPRPRTPARSDPGTGDTTAFSVFDGTVGISAIQSNFRGFGSGQTVRGTGINLNDRGSYFTLRPGHHNLLRPGKLPFHTLMAIYARGPDTELLLGTMGGDVQPQTNVQILTRFVDRHQTLSEAIRAPRFAVPATIYGTAPIVVEAGVVLRGRRRRSRDPSVFGHAQGIACGTSIEVGIDPRGDGLLEGPPTPSTPGPDGIAVRRATGKDHPRPDPRR